MGIIDGSGRGCATQGQVVHSSRSSRCGMVEMRRSAMRYDAMRREDSDGAGQAAHGHDGTQEGTSALDLGW